MKLFATETEACVIDSATIDSARQCLPTMLNARIKTNVESLWSATGVFPGGGATRPTETNVNPPTGTETTHGPTYRFQEGDETV